MDVRDVSYWVAEAKLRRLERRVEAANTALLPHRDVDSRDKYLEALRAEVAAMEQDGGEIEALDRENAALIAEANRKMDERRARRKADRAAGVPPKPGVKRPHKYSKLRAIK